MKNNQITTRSPQEVFEDHLRLEKKGDIEEELRRNVDENIVLLTTFGTFSGHEGKRKTAALLEEQLPNGTFNYKLKLCHGNICFLHWSGDSKKSHILHGIDSYLIENGKIKVQTIYYTVQKK